jgi:hypothetical protein
MVSMIFLASFWPRSKALVQERILLPFQQGQQCLQYRFAIHDKRTLDQVAETNARRIKINLHTLRLTRLGQEFHIWITRADHDERVALFHRGDRRSSASSDGQREIHRQARRLLRYLCQLFQLR